MSYTVTQPPPAKPRPAVVSVAVILLWATLAALLVTTALGFLPNEELTRALDQYYEDHPDVATDATGGSVTTIVLAGFTIAIVIAFAVLAVFVGRGSQPARVVTWVLSGLGVLCYSCVLLGQAAAPALLRSTGGDENVEATRELLELVREHTPDWQYYLDLLLSLFVLVALTAVIILLAVPAANDYFRKEQEIWIPPTDPGGGYPQFPPPAIPQNPSAPSVPPAAPPTPPAGPPDPPRPV
jgi:hypothetical protein